jgi:Flp pilus assembly CpaF family ATPase
MANVGLPHTSIREAIALAIHTIVHIERIGNCRRVTQALAIADYDRGADQFVFSEAIPKRRASKGVAA